MKASEARSLAYDSNKEEIDSILEQIKINALDGKVQLTIASGVPDGVLSFLNREGYEIRTTDLPTKRVVTILWYE